MATQRSTARHGDVEGCVAVQSVELSVNGRSYTIHLDDEHFAELRKALSKYRSAAGKGHC